MSKHLIVLALALTGLAACGSNPGKGETIGTVGGAVVGGVVGNQAGERYDERNRK
jgi:uncharacterized protein YcfJ